MKQTSKLTKEMKKNISTLKKISTELNKFKTYRYGIPMKLYNLIDELNINISQAKITDLLPNRTDVIIEDWRSTPSLADCIITTEECMRYFPTFYMNEIIETIKNN